MRIKLMKQRLMIIIGFVLLCLQILKAQEKVNIWQGTACRKNVEMTTYLAKGGSKMAGPVPPNPGELVTRASLDDIISQLKEHYDYVILDTAPVSTADRKSVV